MLSIFHESRRVPCSSSLFSLASYNIQFRDVFVLKDIEKLSVKKGIVAQTVKDVLQSLIDDDLVRSEKIGISNYFWSFPSEASVRIESELSKVETDVQEVTARRAEVEDQIQRARIGKEASVIRSTKMKELGEIEEALRVCDSELAKFKEVNESRQLLLYQRMT